MGPWMEWAALWGFPFMEMFAKNSVDPVKAVVNGSIV